MDKFTMHPQIPGAQITDHWIVCLGLEVISELLPTLEAAREKAEHSIREGREHVSIQHVGVVSNEQAEAEREMLRDPYYRMGDPFVHPDDRMG